MDRLDAIKIFVRVVESGSFSAVARELGVALGELRISAAPLAHNAVPLRQLQYTAVAAVSITDSISLSVR